MITNEKKENMINEVVKRLGIKKTKIYPSKTNPIVPDDYNSLKGQIEENKKLKFEGLKLARIVLGVGEAVNFPAAIKVTAEYFPKKDRAYSTSIFNCKLAAGMRRKGALIRCAQ